MAWIKKTHKAVGEELVFIEKPKSWFCLDIQCRQSKLPLRYSKIFEGELPTLPLHDSSSFANLYRGYTWLGWIEVPD
ncbi:hypothetical protein EJ110_NYTH43425 [Nymphaea thermarum]|nr:hypothetical protein EJ110_NYTH43425 [Nymphaea thermarum]